MTQDSAEVGGECGTEKESMKTINRQNDDGSNPTPGAKKLKLCLNPLLRERFYDLRSLGLMRAGRLPALRIKEEA